ncbi:MAG: hypothetical protein JXM73_03935 [Anaerolineae bacterium]|nr:hypothetical protein [Anaerolineae bacterium]
MDEIGLSAGTVALVLLLLILPVLFFLTSRVRAGKAGELRRIAGFEDLSNSVGRSAETGQPLHVSVGVGGVGGLSTAETWTGLSLLTQLADEAASCDTPLIVTVADPTVVPVVQDILRRAAIRRGNPDGYDPTEVRFIAPNPIAYAAGVSGILEREPLTSSVMVGSFGDEYLLMGESGARRGVHQVVGTADPGILAQVYASADETLVGEEMFAAGAYTHKLPIQIGSLLAQDWGRWAVAIAIVVLAIWKILTRG